MTEETVLAPASELADVPIGTIVPYAGDCGNVGVIGILGRKGWMPCDGSLLLIDEYPELYGIIRLSFGGVFDGGVPVKYNLPDMTAMFVRGVNRDAVVLPAGPKVDPGADERLAARPGGNTGNNVGSYQPDSTGPPQAVPFQTDVGGRHTHAAHHLTSSDHRAFDGASFYQAVSNSDTHTIQSAGDHHHAIDAGGDPETRSVNVSLFFIIKAY